MFLDTTLLTENNWSTPGRHDMAAEAGYTHTAMPKTKDITHTIRHIIVSILFND